MRRDAGQWTVWRTMAAKRGVRTSLRFPYRHENAVLTGSEPWRGKERGGTDLTREDRKWAGSWTGNDCPLPGQSDGHVERVSERRWVVCVCVCVCVMQTVHNVQLLHTSSLNVFLSLSTRSETRTPLSGVMHLILYVCVCVCVWQDTLWEWEPPPPTHTHTHSYLTLVGLLRLVVSSWITASYQKRTPPTRRGHKTDKECFYCATSSLWCSASWDHPAKQRRLLYVQPEPLLCGV